MIKLEVEKYCENCSRFEPEVDKHQKEFISDAMPFLGPLYNVYSKTDTFISCKNAEHCRILVEYLKSEGGK